MNYLWSSDDLVRAMNGRPVGSLPAGINGISIDTRTIARGEAFFAIKGDRFDGHNFTSAALLAGAGLLVVAESRLPALGRLRVPLIVVEDVLVALGDLARAARQRTKAQIIAVTGSVGKTSTKEMLRHVLSASGNVHASTASFNNHWGVPLTLARMPENTDFGIFEIGMNHAGEIRPLVGMVRPHVAIITTIAPAHLGNFNSIAEIALAKSEIMEGVEKGGYVLLNRDNEKFGWLKKRALDMGIAQVRSFGENKQASIRLMSCRLAPDHSDVTVRVGARDVAVYIGAPGRHVVQNSLAVLGAAWLAGAEMERVAPAFATVTPEKGRGARHRLRIGESAFTLIDESYNANPASMRAALELMHATPIGEGGRRIAVLGDMLEMGRFSEKVHRGLAQVVIDAGTDILCLAGSEMNHLKEEIGERIPVIHAENADMLGAWLKDNLNAGDVVMVKSSLGLGFGRIVNLLQETFPADRGGRL